VTSPLPVRRITLSTPDHVDGEDTVRVATSITSADSPAITSTAPPIIAAGRTHCLVPVGW
jgi:hypothetical protein